MTNNNWHAYIAKTSDRSPSKLLIKAINFVPDFDNALEIGAGALNDVVFLLNSGFSHITAIDKTEANNENLKNLQKDRVDYIINDIVDVDLKPGAYSLVTSQYTLPFIGPENFNTTFTRIKASIKPNGILVGQLFGINDDWSSNNKIIFHTLYSIKEILHDMQIIDLVEEHRDGSTALNGDKHWHVFHIIARKPE